MPRPVPRYCGLKGSQGGSQTSGGLRTIQALREFSGTGARAKIMILEGKLLQYLIGGDDSAQGRFELSFDAEGLPWAIGVAQVNAWLFGLRSLSSGIARRSSFHVRSTMLTCFQKA